MASVQIYSRNIEGSIRNFINKIKSRGTQLNTQNELYNLKRKVLNEKRFYDIIKQSVGNNSFQAIKNRIVLPSNGAIAKMSRNNAKRWNKSSKNTWSRISYVTNRYTNVPRRRVKIPKRFI